MLRRVGPRSLDADIRSVGTDGVTVRVEYADGHVGRHNRFWLRYNCPADGERASLFRTFSVTDMAPALRVASVALVEGAVRIEFDDGTADRFDPGWLRQHSDVPERPHPSVPPRPDPIAMPAASLAVDSAGHHRLLEAVAADGVALVSGVDDTESLAALLGPIRETDFGRVFDIISEPDPFTPSQSTIALDPHTDDPYRYSPAGVSVLHCVTPSDGEGGASTIVDGFAVAAALRAEDPEAFDLLGTVAVPFVHRREVAVAQGDAVHLRADAPIISVDPHGVVVGVRFHERSMATLTIDADLAERYYPALASFVRRVRSGTHTWTRRLAAGDAIVYDNQRVLHGRTAFTGASGRRHLRLFTVDRDQVHSRLRRLRAAYGTGTECDPLPSGSLS